LLADHPEHGGGVVTADADLLRHLTYLLAQYDRLVRAHALVVMDTPEDRELHDRVVVEFRNAADPVRRLLTDRASGAVS
jgi:hypothetical protein